MDPSNSLVGEDDSREFIRPMSLAMTYFKSKMDA